MTREYTCAPGDYIPCPECAALGGPDGMTKARGVMTDREYADRRCNKCGHLWAVGDTLDLPLEVPEKPVEQAKGESGTQPPPSPETTSGSPDYDFGDGFVREDVSIPF